MLKILTEYGDCSGMAKMKQNQKNDTVVQSETFEFLNHVLAGTPHAALIADSKGFVIDTNLVAERIFGYSNTEMKQLSLKILLKTDADLKVALNEGAGDLEIEFINRNKHVFSVDASINKIYLSDQKTPYLLLLLADKSDKGKHQSSLIDRLKFEELISDLSLRFMNLPYHKIDTEIENGLYDIFRHLNVERISLNQFFENQTELIQTHSICRTGNRPYLGKDLMKQIPWQASQIAQKKIVLLTDIIKRVPIEYSKERAFIAAEKVMSGLALPLSIEGTLLGIVILTSFREEYVWSDELKQQMQIVCNVMANALLRKKTQQELKDKLEFESLLSELSASFINPEGGPLEKSIYRWLDRTCSQLKIDSCSLYQKSTGRDDFILTARDESPAEATSWPQHINQALFPLIWNQILEKKVVSFPNLTDPTEEAAIDLKNLNQYGFQSLACFPLKADNDIFGLLIFWNLHCRRSELPELRQRLKVISDVISSAIQRKTAADSLEKALDEINRLNRQLVAEHTYLKEEINLQHNHKDIIGESKELQYTLFKVEQAAPTDTTILIQGETGTGKELIARAIHNASKRSHKPLIKLNCAALSPSLVESELFGHEKGAYTGASDVRIGRFELAHGTTLFLDEIGELPLELQPKLLRVLQEGEFERMGSSKTRRVDVRIIAATNRDLKEEVQKGLFRKDLWYRLNIYPITIPPLRKRKDDIPLLVNWFVGKLSKKLGKTIKSIPSATIKKLQTHPWPGNIRELENTLERTIIHTDDSVLRLADSLDFSPETGIEDDCLKTLKELERDHIMRVLKKTNGKIYGPNGAGLILEINPETLRYRMKKLGIKKQHVRL